MHHFSVVVMCTTWPNTHYMISLYTCKVTCRERPHRQSTIVVMCTVWPNTHYMVSLDTCKVTCRGQPHRQSTSGRSAAPQYRIRSRSFSPTSTSYNTTPSTPRRPSGSTCAILRTCQTPHMPWSASEKCCSLSCCAEPRRAVLTASRYSRSQPGGWYLMHFAVPHSFVINKEMVKNNRGKMQGKGVAAMLEWACRLCSRCKQG